MTRLKQLKKEFERDFMIPDGSRIYIKNGGLVVEKNEVDIKTKTNAFTILKEKQPLVWQFIVKAFKEGKKEGEKKKLYNLDEVMKNMGLKKIGENTWLNPNNLK